VAGVAADTREEAEATPVEGAVVIRVVLEDIRAVAIPVEVEDIPRAAVVRAMTDRRQ
jgi:hypothetical protein